MRKGSITLFSLLSMILVASALLALLEAGRFQGIKQLAQLQTKVALESVFAEYNTYLWEEYRLLACEQDKVSEEIEKSVEYKLLNDDLGINFFQFQIKEIKEEGCTRLTDGNGSAFIQAVAGYMEQNLLYESAKTIYNRYEGIKEIVNSSGFDFTMIEDALEEMQQEQASAGSSGNTTIEMESEEDNEVIAVVNPLEAIQGLQQKGLLALVIEDTSLLSDKKIDLSKTIWNRKLSEANNPALIEANWYDRVLLQQYLLTYMSSYTNEKEHFLKYEVEYLLGGKETEVENMKVVVSQLLGIREAANFLYLTSCPAKVEQARVLAAAVVGSTLNPVLVEVVKTALLAAWAFAESVLDVRTLLTGGKIALLKSDTVWTLDLDCITTIGEEYSKAKNCENGLSYSDYLGILLLFQEENQLARRGLDVQELTVREKYENEDIYLDEWMVEVKVYVTYRYRPVFFSINRILPEWNYEFSVRSAFEY